MNSDFDKNGIVGICTKFTTSTNGLVCDNFSTLELTNIKRSLQLDTYFGLLLSLLIIYLVYYVMNTYVNESFDLKSFNYNEFVVYTLFIMIIVNIIFNIIGLNSLSIGTIISMILALSYINKDVLLL